MNKSNTARDMKFRRIIGGYIEVSGLTREQIAANLGINVKSFRSRMHDPDMFRRGELITLCNTLRVSPEDRRELI